MAGRGTGRVSVPIALFVCLALLEAALPCQSVHFYKVPTTAMEPTIKMGETVAVCKISMTEPLARGEIVVYRTPQTTDGRLALKRVVALPHDSILIKSKEVFINGQPLVEPYVAHTDPSIYPDRPLPKGLERRDQLPSLTVPEGTVFLLGDNRDSSWDSRFFGPVQRIDIVARVFDK
jgi:signal peptidase I